MFNLWCRPYKNCTKHQARGSVWSGWFDFSKNPNNIPEFSCELLPLTVKSSVKIVLWLLVRTETNGSKVNRVMFFYYLSTKYDTTPSLLPPTFFFLLRKRCSFVLPGCETLSSPLLRIFTPSLQPTWRSPFLTGGFESWMFCSFHFTLVFIQRQVSTEVLPGDTTTTFTYSNKVKSGFSWRGSSCWDVSTFIQKTSSVLGAVAARP